MASISSLMGGTSSSGSIYGSRSANIISGLASGLDTETMIEGLVQSYQQKITGLEQDRTKLQWQQEAYQSISDKLVEFARKYTSYSYSSGTNLFSNSFFNNAVTTTTGGAFANLVSAAGKTSSSVTIDAVAQLATAAKYTVNNTRLGSLGSGTVTSGTVSLGDTTNVSTIEGSLTLTYGSKNLTVSFGELDLFNKADGTLDTTALETAINDQLKAQQVTIGDSTYTGDQLFDVTVDSSGSLTLSDKLNAGNSPYISKASGDFASLVTTDLSNASEDRPATVQLDMSKAVVDAMDTGDYLSGKTLSVTLNGQTKQISLDNITAGAGQTFADAFKTELQNRLDTAFGSGKITVDLQGGKLSYTVASGSTFSISSFDAGSILGMEDGTLTSYLDTGKSLGSLLDENAWNNLTPVDQDSEGRDLYALTINGVEVGRYTRDTALETVINGINSSDAGVNVSYSNLTNQFVFTAKETGEGGRIQIDGGLAEALFGAVDPAAGQAGYTAGTDAVFRTTVNGTSMTLTRSTNTFEVDGMSVTLSGTFNTGTQAGSTPITSQDVANQVAAGTDAGYFDLTGEAVSFTSATDADTIVDAVKQMVTDYNAIMEEVKKAYTDMPLRKTNGDRYEPLTDEDRADMSEGAIKEYEEQAKTGILFMDSDISSLYNALRSAITTPSGSDGSFLRSIGISTSYSDGLTTLTLDEDALRQALATNPDQVRDAFTKSEEGGAATDGLMASIQKVTDRYAATTGATKGILIEKAGSQYSPTSALNNTMLSKIQDVDDEIERWQGKLSDQVDFYTNKFTQLEMLINQMNSQSSALAGLMGGY